ncbi:MAG: hypothetical protein IPJ07_25290 [Acidobacteria bacterium]|nr:hypothetical protein [Acidobacteriota bacterium]
MKKFGLMIALGIFASLMVLSPTVANAQDEKQTELERNFYDACYTKKDMTTCLTLAKELKGKYPTSTYIKYADGQIKKDKSDKFQNALTAFYNGPDAPKLDQLVANAEDYLTVETGDTAVAYIVTRVALATSYGVMGGIYKDADKAKSFSERALKAMANEAAPQGWDAKDYTPLRDTTLAQLNQFLGYQILQANGAPEQAVEYLNKAIAVKHKDGLGWKDPNNYFLRSNATFQEYQKLSKEYQALSDDQKTGDAGKAVLAKINPTIDKMLADYARVLATATKPETKVLKDGAKEQFDQFWKYRTGSDAGAAEFVKAFEADPTVPGPTVPAKAETSDTPAAGAPPAGAANAPKLTTAVSANSSTGTASTEKAGGKAAPAKGKAAPVKRKPRR